jgi:hypothetical protein
MDIVGLRVPTRNLRDFPLCHVSSSYTNCPSTRCELRQIQLVVNWMSSEGKLSHLVRCDVVLLRYY